MSGKLFRSIFWLTVAVFVTIVFIMFLATRFSVNRYFVFIGLPAWILWMVLGVILIVLTLQKKVGGKLKIYLLLAGASAAGFLVFVVLHNLVSAVWHIEEAVFFIISVVLCPAGFLAGAIGTIILSNKNKPSGYLNQNMSGGETN